MDPALMSQVETRFAISSWKIRTPLIKVQCPQHITRCPQHITRKVVVVWVETLFSVRKVAVSNLGPKAAILSFVFLFLRPN